jgi:hypothetical protein
MTNQSEPPYEHPHLFGECQGCDDYTTVDEMGLCDTCSQKLDRDLIRKRDWAYSVSAFGVPKEKLEDLRNHVIKNYGKALELIAEDPPREKRAAKERKQRKKAKRQKARQKKNRA